MNHLLQQINLRKYLPFYTPYSNNNVNNKNCSEKNYALAIYSQYGTRQMLESSVANESIINALQSINNKTFNWDSLSSKNNFQQLGEQGFCHYVQLTLGANEQHYWLFGISVSSSNVSLEQHSRSQSILQHIAHCLQEDYTLASSLNGMADELAIRYEELHLLYGIEDHDSTYKNQNEKESLQQLLNNSVDYLRIDMAIVYLPELQLCLYSINQLNSINHELLINIVYEKIYPFMSKHQETLVINRNQDNDWTDAGLKIPYKFIVTPIVKKNQSLNGILVLVNQLTSQDFSNSDRKLTEIMAAEASKLTQARRDVITGDLNRRGLTEILGKAIDSIQSNPKQLCLLLINIDQFKVINDTSGQIGGDQLLKRVNALIKKNLNRRDVLGRLGADEFAVLLNDCNLEDAKNIANRIRVEIKQYRFFYQDNLFDISACVGIVELTNDITDFSEALRSADLACSVAKEHGRNRVHVFNKNDENLISHEDQMQWVSRINLGLEENRFLIYRQRILALQEQESLDHYEILLRLKDSEGNILSPFNFIPAAERYGLMTKLDRWVIKTTLEKLAYTNKTQPQNIFYCSINLSGQSFCEDGFSDFIIDQIEQSGVSPHLLCFEITETAAVSNMTQTVNFMEKLKAIGCTFSLDDFGSGMSSFTYLKNLPVDTLKIDGYFVKTMLENDIDKAMVSSIHQISNVMGLKTIAEFVENDAILEELRNMGVDYGQGYGIGKPHPF